MIPVQRPRLVPAIALVLSLALVGLAAPASAAEPVPLSVGDSARGQLGNGSLGSRTSPGPVDVSGAVALASGRDHGYALDGGGRVWAWGAGDKGQVGDGGTADRPTPVRLSLTDVVQLEAGHYHGIALRSDGTVWTWGFGNLGQLGLGTTSNRRQPTMVPGLSGVVSVAAGRDASYAVLGDGTVRAWGSNALGEVGDGTTTRRLSPTAVTGLTGVAELGVGRNHVLARTGNGSVWAWGANDYGQLGDATTTRRLQPVRISVGPARHVDAGAHHSIAVLDDGRVLTWGRGYRGQLGLGSTGGRSTPTVVPGIPAMVEVGDGRDTSFAMTATGDVWAWGENTSGQLGDGTTLTRTSPVRLTGISGIAATQGGALHTLFMPITGIAPPPGNVAPTASFTASCTDLGCSFDGRASVDSDGTITNYAWDFGDGATGTSATTTHPYATAGTYTVRLTVTDNQSATGTTTRTVTVTNPPAPTGDVAFAGAAFSTGNATSARLTLPAPVQPGDQLLLFLTTNRAATTTGPTAGGTWRLLQNGFGDLNQIQTWVWERTAVAGDAGRVVAVPLNVRAKYVLTAAAYRGATVDSSTFAAETVNRAAHTTPAATLDDTGSWVVSYWSDKTSATTDWASATGVQDRAEPIGAGSGRVTSLLADSNAPLPNGTTPGLTATANAASRKATMVNVVLRPTA